jgi:hypothetical protein
MDVREKQAIGRKSVETASDFKADRPHRRSSSGESRD